MMKKIVCAVGLAVMPMWVMAQNTSPVGTWQSVDEEGEQKAVVRITQDANGDLRGTIIKLNQKPGALCAKCKGDQKDKPIEGMSVIWGLKQVGENKWGEGAILDPAKGETYSLKAELIENGQRFKLRGFMGISLLGRTQIWNRID